MTGPETNMKRMRILYGMMIMKAMRKVRARKWLVKTAGIKVIMIQDLTVIINDIINNS